MKTKFVFVLLVLGTCFSAFAQQKQDRKPESNADVAEKRG